MEEFQFTRQELYDLIWTESILSLSKKYDISDVGLRKKCKALEIPIPHLGYWAKLKFGKKVVPRAPLKEFKGDPKVVLRLRDKSEISVMTRSMRIKQIENDASLTLTVPEKLSNPDPLITHTKDDLLKSKVYKKNEGIVCSSSSVLKVNGSPNYIRRALRILDTLIKALKQRGHDIEIGSGRTNVVVEGEKIPICLREKLVKVNVPGKYGGYTEYKASGELSIRIDESYSTKEWAEGKKPLEDQFVNILVYLEMKGKQMREERIQRERYREEQKAIERIEKELQDKQEKELNDFLDLFRVAERHAKAEKIRRYAQELVRIAAEKDIVNENLLQKIEWARKKADWYDPLIEADDELMRGIDREELKLHKKFFCWLDR